MGSVQIPAWAAVIVAILGAVGGLSGIAALIDARSKASSSRVDSLCEIIDRLEAEVRRLDVEVTKWKAKYFELVNWVRDVGLEPFEDNEWSG